MKVYNSLTFQTEEFKTINQNQVLMYVCGPTVYDDPHLGHAKSAVAFDVIRRYLEYKGYDVNIVKNYTDIDDKIIKRANEKGIDYQTLSEKYIKSYEDIMDKLKVKEDTQNPRATDIIDFMIEVIQTLIQKEYAYESNGSVYFSVNSYEGYNQIFQNVKKNEEEEDYEIPEEEEPLYGEKYDPKDFVLWKKKKEGEPYWESPWGEGRPGWHIECTCMAVKYLPDVIDIHGGGLDLKAPHHKNEIAQTTAYTGEEKFANYFFHNGFVNVDDEKMSKSLGNFFLVTEILKKYEPMVVRLFLIQSHYRRSVNFTLDSMNQAKKNYERMINTITTVNETTTVDTATEENKELSDKVKDAKKRMLEAMDDDFNTPEAFAEILTLFKEINRAILENDVNLTEDFKDIFFQLIQDIDVIFGIFPDLKERLKFGVVEPVNERDKLIKNLLEIIKTTRQKLRKQENYELSDEIRDKLHDLGIKIEDK